jgi:hypothetical protein
MNLDDPNWTREDKTFGCQSRCVMAELSTAPRNKVTRCCANKIGHLWIVSSVGALRTPRRFSVGPAEAGALGATLQPQGVAVGGGKRIALTANWGEGGGCQNTQSTAPRNKVTKESAALGLWTRGPTRFRGSSRHQFGPGPAARRPALQPMVVGGGNRIALFAVSTGKIKTPRPKRHTNALVPQLEQRWAGREAPTAADKRGASAAKLGKALGRKALQQVG